ncbi:MAG: serine/threonine-protein kinase [Polyangia bacterium]|jgi:serine/threonine-protein kinase|nr:serine/threonine-protein kinase [Polyangia bacterium]
MASGGMATLYLARITGPQEFEKLLCIKKVHDHLSDDREFTEMFLDECRIAALIHHPNVATVFEMGRVESSYFMAMEYVHGHDLREVLAAAKRLPDSLSWMYAARIVADAAAGLHAAHELKRPGGAVLGVVHRDVSHQNILISYDGHVKVVDFGIAFARERISHTAVKTLKGKAAYMSPEQATQKPLDRRSDIFSLGTVLFEAITLRRLFKASTEVETLLRVRQARVPRPRTLRPELPARLEQIVLKALAPAPEDRYQTAAQLQGALEALLVEEQQVSGQQQLADLMDRLFHAQREDRDRIIEEARTKVNTGALSVVRFRQVEEGSLSQLSESRGLRPWLHNQRWLLAGALGGAALVILAVLTAFLLGKGRGGPPAALAPQSREAAMEDPRIARESPRPSRDASSPTSTRPSEPATVSLEIRVLPEGAQATLRFRERKYSGPVFRAQLRRTEAEEVVEISAPGFRTQSLMIVPLEDQKHEIKLQRLQVFWRRPPLRWKALPD